MALLRLLEARARDSALAEEQKMFYQQLLSRYWLFRSQGMVDSEDDIVGVNDGSLPSLTVVTGDREAVIYLTKMERQLLALLEEGYPRVVSYQTFYQELWPGENVTIRSHPDRFHALLARVKDKIKPFGYQILVVRKKGCHLVKIEQDAELLRQNLERSD